MDWPRALSGKKMCEPRRISWNSLNTAQHTDQRQTLRPSSFFGPKVQAKAACALHLLIERTSFV